MDTALLKELGATEDTTLRQVKALAQQRVEELDRIIAAAQEKRQVFSGLLGLWNKTDEIATPKTNGSTSTVSVTADAASDLDPAGSGASPRTRKTSKTTASRAKKGGSSTETKATTSKAKTTTKPKTTTRKAKSTAPKTTEAKPELFDFNALLPKFAGKSYQEAFIQILESEPENEFSVGDIVKEAYGNQLQGNSFMRVCQIVGREMTRGLEQGLWVKSSQKPPRYASKIA